MRRLLVAVLLSVAAVGCSVPDASPPPPAAETAPVAAEALSLPDPQPRPVRVSVPGRGIDGEVMIDGLGVDAGGGHEEPPVEDPLLASWYNLGPRPGEQGPAVVLGHVNGGGQDGIFAGLKDVVPGDQVVVAREDGSPVTFEVYRNQEINKSEFPTQEVYGSTSGSEVRLITCGGGFDGEHYLKNVIVYARLVETP